MQITCNTLDAYHVQHIGRLSHATRWTLITCNTLDAYHVQHVRCHMVREDSSAIQFVRVYIQLYFCFILLAETITDNTSPVSSFLWQLARDEAVKLLETDPATKDKARNVNAVLIDHYLWDYRRDHAADTDHIPFHKVRCIYY